MEWVKISALIKFNERIDGYNLEDYEYSLTLYEDDCWIWRRLDDSKKESAIRSYIDMTLEMSGISQVTYRVTNLGQVYFYEF